MNIPTHAWVYLRNMCERERIRLNNIECLPGNMLPMMASWDSLNEIECMIPHEYWQYHERFDTDVCEMDLSDGN